MVVAREGGRGMKRWLIVLAALVLLGTSLTAFASEDAYQRIFAAGGARLREKALAAESAEESHQTALDKGQMSVVSVSPDGQTVLLSMDSDLFVLTQGKLSLLNARDVTTGQAEEYLSDPVIRRLGAEGAVWSPNSRYVVFPNARSVTTYLRSVPLMMADTKAGEIFPIKTYQQTTGVVLESFMQGVFSPDSQAFYYTDIVGGITRLNRYSLRDHTSETLTEVGENAYGYPGMACGGDTLTWYAYQNAENRLNVYHLKDGALSQQPLALPRALQPQYYAAAGQTVLTSQSVLSGIYMGMVHLLDGKPLGAQVGSNGLAVFHLGEPLDTQEALDAWLAVQEDYKNDPARVAHLAVSPDGRYALAMLLFNNYADHTFWLLDVNTLQAVPVEADLGENPVVYLAKGARYMPGLSLEAGGMVVASTDGLSAKLYQLEPAK